MDFNFLVAQVSVVLSWDVFFTKQAVEQTVTFKHHGAHMVQTYH